jgi:hypothetical protein
MLSTIVTGITLSNVVLTMTPFPATDLFRLGLYLGIQKSIPKKDYPSLSSENLSKLPLIGWLILTSAAVLIVILAAVHIRLAWRDRRAHFWRRYFGSGVGLVVLVASAFVIAPHWGGRNVHVHHYMWSSALACFTTFPTTLSVICQALLFGCYTQELAGGGVLSFFDPANMTAS